MGQNGRRGARNWALTRASPLVRRDGSRTPRIEGGGTETAWWHCHGVMLMPIPCAPGRHEGVRTHGTRASGHVARSTSAEHEHRCRYPVRPLSGAGQGWWQKISLSCRRPCTGKRLASLTPTPCSAVSSAVSPVLRARVRSCGRVLQSVGGRVARARTHARRRAVCRAGARSIERPHSATRDGQEGTWHRPTAPRYAAEE